MMNERYAHCGRRVQRIPASEALPLPGGKGKAVLGLRNRTTLGFQIQTPAAASAL